MVERSWIRASEIQAYSYCARSWWLQHVLGLEPENRDTLDAGAYQHRRHGEVVMRAGRFGLAGAVFLLLALLLAGLAVWWLLRGG